MNANPSLTDSPSASGDSRMAISNSSTAFADSLVKAAPAWEAVAGNLSSGYESYSAPGLFSRNRSLMKETLVMALTVGVLTIGATILAGLVSGIAALITGIAVLCLFLAYSARRYREIGRLAAEVDEVLHDGRSVDFSNCQEGDIAVLRSELSKMVSRLRIATESLQREKESLADSLADISHQIRTPLTAMSLMLPALESCGYPKERKLQVRRLESLVDRLSWLVTTLLKLAKLDAGSLEMNSAEVDARDTINRAVEPLLPVLDLHSVELKREDMSPVSFTGDELWTAEAIQNIVKNSMEHTPAGGTITITATEDALASHITITDNGAGISPTDLPHVFERFYRGTAAADLRSQPEGFGVGLALAQSLIAAQGGTLRASNNSTKGATFEIAFPKLTI